MQFRRGAPKPVALRNNLIAALNGNDLAYYTDTEIGSSGSPVCDDRWRVVALHKGATIRFGTLQDLLLTLAVSLQLEQQQGRGAAVRALIDRIVLP